MNGLSRMRATLPKLVFSRTGVLFFTALGAFLLRTLSTVVLTRLLSPEVFGIVGIVMAILFTLNMLTDLGFQSFVVRHHSGDQAHFLDVIWTIHAGRGAMLTLVCAVAAPFLAQALGKPVLALPLAAASMYFLLNGMASLSLYSALRDDGSRKLSIFDFALQLFQTTLCLMLAIWLRSVWSIIIALISQWTLRALLSFTLFQKSSHRLARDPAISREFFAFSRVVIISSSISLLIAQSDKIVLARLFTLPQFGLYAIALGIASAPVLFIDSYITRVIYPLYASTWRAEPTAVGSIYYKSRRIPSRLYAFFCGSLVGGAGLAVAILYDRRYSGAAVYVALLGIASTLHLPNFAAAEFMTATGRIKSTLHANVVRLGWLTIAIPVGFLCLGSTGIVAAVGFAEVPVLFYSGAVLRRLGVFEWREELSFVLLACAGVAAGYMFSFGTLLLIGSL